MLLLEIQDDDSSPLWAAFMWMAAIGALILWSKYVKRRDAAAAAVAIDPAARDGVAPVRERMQRQRSGSVGGAAAGGGSHSSSGSAGANSVEAAAAAAAPREREDCPICLSTVTWPVDTNCAHTFCCQCFISYHEQAGGVSRPMVKCPCCRREVDMILPTPPGWTSAEKDSNLGQKLSSDLAAYNARFSGEPRSWAAAAQDTPHLLSRFVSTLLSGGPESLQLMRQARLWLLIGSAFFYLISPFDFIPEAMFGLAGLIDDFFVVIVVCVMVAGMVRNVWLQRAAQMA